MAYEKVKQYFESVRLGDRVRVLDQSSATVQMAADAVGCEPKQIAKTLSFIVDEAPILIVAAGNTKINNQKYKATFSQKSTMIPGDQVEDHVGHDPGGVCPFAIKPGVTVYLDESLRQNTTVYPAAGSANSVVRLSLEELERHSAYKEWIDVCKIV
ncbi:MAG: YbaK/EbsC family protein [Fastidiosipilaceae bacterium]|jgi:prolyl-tRNA editing enzyme YbaK/EbsC (Cys-tRNA(Pro) deacylase)